MSTYVYTSLVAIKAVILTIPADGRMEVAIPITDDIKDIITATIQRKLQGSDMHERYLIDYTSIGEGIYSVIPRSSLGNLYTGHIALHHELRCTVSFGAVYTIVDIDNVKVDRIYVQHIPK